jgi:hypothetical protein
MPIYHYTMTLVTFQQKEMEIFYTEIPNVILEKKNDYGKLKTGVEEYEKAAMYVYVYHCGVGFFGLRNNPA